MSQDADRIVIHVDRPATVRVRYTYTNLLSISGGARVLGGQVVVTNQQPHGTHVHVRIPVTAP